RSRETPFNLDTRPRVYVYFEVRPRSAVRSKRIAYFERRGHAAGQLGRHFRENATRSSRTTIYATLAQLVEHSIRNRKVVGSNPTGGSIEHEHFTKMVKCFFVCFFCGRFA